MKKVIKSIMKTYKAVIHESEKFNTGLLFTGSIMQGYSEKQYRSPDQKGLRS